MQRRPPFLAVERAQSQRSPSDFGDAPVITDFQKLDLDRFRQTEIGEAAIEYLKRLSPSWRLYLAFEGAEDEIECIPELQWHISNRVFIKLNSAFGVTSKADDWAPEIGVMFSF